jgi:hypothetical protein
MGTPEEQGPDLQIDERGEIRVLDEEARSVIQIRSGLWRIAPSLDDVLLLERFGTDAGAERVVLSGTIPGTSVVDIVSFLHGAKKGGTLTLVSGETCKAVLFDSGNVVSAVSNREEDRLGEILYRYGKITREQLAEALSAVGETRRLGKVLVDRGFINSHELWSFIRKQVEEIFYSVLLLSEGLFYFSVPGHPEYFPANVPMSTQGLMMEGIRRIDELRYFRQQIPSAKVVVEPVWPRPATLQIDPHEEALLAQIRGPVTIEELARSSLLGEFETTRIVFHLLQGGAVRKANVVEVAAGTATAEARIEGLIDTFNQIFREIFATIGRSGRASEFRRGLSSFLTAHGYPDLFREVTIEENGELSKATLMANLAQAGVEQKTDYLYAGLNELLFFEIFGAREILGQEEEQALMRRVNALFQKLR